LIQLCHTDKKEKLKFIYLELAFRGNQKSLSFCYMARLVDLGVLPKLCPPF
jgi:hypothetical protein